MSKKIGLLFLALVGAAITLVVRNEGFNYQNECASNNTRCTKVVSFDLPEEEIVEKANERDEYSYNLVDEALIDHEMENERLVIQRDTEKSLKKYFKKPFNYKGSFECVIKVKKEKLSITNCEDNAVYLRSAKLAQQKAKLLKVSPKKIQGEFFLKVSF